MARRGAMPGFGRFGITVARRVATAIPALFGIVAVTFILMRVLPGDPASLFASSPTAGPAELAELRARLGLDRPILEQFLIYLRHLAGGDLGRSMTTGQPVAADLLQRLPASLELVVCSFVLALGTSLPLGIAAGLRPGSAIDHAARLVAALSLSLPTFVTGLLLIYCFYYLLGWAPAPAGRLDVFITAPPLHTGFLLLDSLIAGDGAAFRGALAQLVLPAATLALFVVAPLTRTVRASLLSVMHSDFIRTAHSIGLSPARVVIVYGLHNALLPVLTISGTVISGMLGASVLVEHVFAWPGIASYALDALMAADFAPVQGFVLLVAALYVLVNLGIDILYRVVDPRVALA
jgi:peptide/nickel transport system permease protein